MAKIDHIDVANLRFEYAPERQFQYGGGRCTARVTSLIFVHTDDGKVGIGSAYSHPAMVHLLVTHQFAPLLRGRDAGDVEGLWNLMYGVSRWYGRKGAAMSALGGIDVALWDLRGKAAGKPIYELITPGHASASPARSPAYGSALLWKDHISELEEEAAALIARGFRRVKMRLGRSEAYDVEAVRAVRRAIGSGNDLLVDASMRYNVPLARRMGKLLRELKVFWYEEPFAPEDVMSYAELAKDGGVPIAAGENEFGVQGFSELIRAKAVDIVQPDASRTGGISEVWRVAKLAKEHGLRFAPHTWSDAVIVTANAHVVSAMPNGVTVEVDQTGNPFIEKLLVEPLQVRDGYITLSKKPGLGVEVDMKVVEQYRMADPLNVPDGRYSDLVFGAGFLTPAGPYEEQA
jgi:L-alanine-DL-glutamate epimerase-like enolase superfamily enzyme